MSAAKARGTRWETALVRAFRAVGIHAFKPHQEGRQDVGDLHGLSPFIGQAKDWRSWEDAIREGLDGAERQHVAAGEMYGVAFVKRARRGVWDGYAVTTVITFARLLRRLQRAEELLRELSGPEELFAMHMRDTQTELEITPDPAGAAMEWHLETEQ